jgi:hypothetical protein
MTWMMQVLVLEPLDTHVPVLVLVLVAADENAAVEQQHT